ncbi:MAG: hypothetical protein P0Y49_04845 [Candidatus Pedobacter colombiensis]|uniref:Restriction endonuclease n=1 Tax=Candidatus Pedobacter colombiensis TaxID=3121371 RepID=A0AAJ6B822_9SPHI|nr:hypothetical protein [Pedobacter sp.]WEK20464.1 MAG: hypothetical protein P0Y49_04845 [Pedobacter sp.]
MTQLDFINKIRDAYLSARKCIYTPEKNSEILSRGTSHSISSITEDLFGCYCVNKVSDKERIKIYVDPPVSFKGTELKNKSNKKALLIRPDLMITKDNIATCFFDLKTDLGYKRKDFFNQAKERNDQLNLIKGKRSTSNDGETKGKNHITISENIKFVYVVVSQGNIRKSVQDEFIEQIRSLENVDVFLLTTGDHLNSYHENPKWGINQNHFDSLDELLNEYLD